ncbi:MAG TPA: tellurite resistance TerB family protein [Rhizobiaceae bacterium]|nr:tellurite resistance TerB family protein [Rhizobiaceae bacterium]
MSSPSVHEALVYIMVVMSAADRNMTDEELVRIGNIVRTWPVFVDFDEERLVEVSQDCQKLLQREDGLSRVLSQIKTVVPKRLHDTAYALAFEVAAVDLEMRLEELRVLQLLRESLVIEPSIVEAIERAAKARHRMLQ